MCCAGRGAGWLCLWLALACGSDASNGDSSGGSGGPSGTSGNTSGGGTGGGSSTGTGSGGSSAGAGGSSAGAGGSQAGAGGSSAGAGGTQAGTGGSSGGSCGAASGGGSGASPAFNCNSLGGSCGGCIAEKCCELATLCARDEDCACMASCIGTQSLSGVDGCLQSCGLSGSPPGFADFAVCTATTCPDGDECSAPSGFTPPPDAAPAGGSSSAGIGSGALADCSFDSGLAYDENGPVLQLESADKSVCVRIERRDDGPGSMANTSFTLLSMHVGPPGEVVLIDDPSAVCWYSSHHNFNDWAHAWSGSRHYDLKMARADHGVPPTYMLHVFEQGPLEAGNCSPAAEGSCPIGDPIELLPVQ